MRAAITLAVTLFAFTATAADWATEADALYSRRDEPGVSDRLKKMIEETLKEVPGSYAALWRLLRIAYWQSEPLTGEAKAAAGLACWDVAKRAVAASPNGSTTSPNGVEALYWEAVCVGARAEGLGMVHALWDGLEQKFRAPLDAALDLNKTYQNCAPLRALGRYWYQLPWPKYAGAKSIAALEEAIKICPKDLRARVYLAETLVKEGQAPRAQSLLEEVAKGDENYDPPEARRAKALGKAVRARL